MCLEIYLQKLFLRVYIQPCLYHVYRHINTIFTDISTACLNTCQDLHSLGRHFYFVSEGIFPPILKTYLQYVGTHVLNFMLNPYLKTFWEHIFIMFEDMNKQLFEDISIWHLKTCEHPVYKFFLKAWGAIHS